ncbi:putative porin [Oceanisphaera litoralis]|uniref:porin n=1 Tax=Oceanisphaera litoralis TaxID=225144 RepID=UPI00195CFF2D|nr:porin [Oceanisphaera litoralis]MBM7456994.1 putative porin [Oceanisphaera litoralis]
MKKTILALTIPALFATSASAVTVYSDEGAQVDLYGRIQIEGSSQDYQEVNGDATSEAENFGGQGEARLGANVKYQLNNDVDLIGKLEWQVAAEKSDDSKFDSRYAWAGFRFMDTTDLTFGRVNSPYAQALDYTDILNVFGGQAAFGEELGTTDKLDDMVRLSYAANGVDLRAGYAFNDNDKLDANADDYDADGEENRWNASAGYTAPFGLGVVAAYEQISFLDGLDQDNWIVGLNYSLDGFYFAAIYTEREKDVLGGGKNEAEGYELHAEYNVDAWKVLAQYSKEEYDAVGADKYDSLDNITLGVQYKLTSKAKLYAEYVISDSEMLNGAGDVVTKDDLYGVGIQYNF